ncbi:MULTISPECIES: MDR family MFS transporter [Thermoactinomyces]|jgi:EmrB/QacA subfamily drug resistance transporter|uniref:MFS transporter n=1 Tax=Thermoactinomyces vulgaris TaxID=2026 RepID=A0ABS0QJ20_THEVU|nr:MULTISPECIES: MDR family MFS transporter [Thermoactinomyces]KFZ40250.1 major facilitator transporter [Thermoactinomyces sp. Gus2-1]MBA4552243.1 MFS transporter [Thermoactinomyces vulgaris]MBA4597549.1 MFS transporter [Thermoactinomyces vulgaris]MBH8584691.1 MFS transporter [Thermoactinomyces sp. CICC 10520]MBH8589187.1 MFS transporter [Thermoactinomyces vulgaris]
MDSKKSNFQLVVASLLLAIFMSAMDNTIVATAMGTIVGELGGLDQFVWVTSAYMVTYMAGMPIFGKLSDMYGRKRFFIFGLTIFLIGSALCGTAQSIVQLSIYRAIQGIGGGALMPIAFTIVFDIFPPEQRGKMTGLLGAVFGSSSVAGPLLGAYITDYISWHWIFYVNLPIGIISLVLILTAYKESNKHEKQAIDWWGAVTLVTAVVSLMFALELGGKEYAWNSLPIISLFVIFAVFFLAFLYVETKAKEPIISFWMFKRRLFAASQIAVFLYGATFVVLTVYIPIFVQAVYGGSATNAGLILTPMMLGSVVGSAIGGIFQTKTSYRNLMILSIIAYAAGMTLLSTMTPETARWLVTIYMVIAGFGVGFSFSLLPIASVHNMDAKHRGSANSTNSFFRSLGMTIGITLFGSLQNRFFTDQLDFGGMQGGHGPSFDLNDPQGLFEPGARAAIPDFILDKIVDAMSSSITHIFALALIPIVLAAIAILFMGDTRVKMSKKPVVSTNE